jgi:hypothetical protein
MCGGRRASLPAVTPEDNAAAVPGSGPVPAEVYMRPFAVRLLSSAGGEPAEAGELTLLNSGPQTLA